VYVCVCVCARPLVCVCVCVCVGARAHVCAPRRRAHLVQSYYICQGKRNLSLSTLCTVSFHWYQVLSEARSYTTSPIAVITFLCPGCCTTDKYTPPTHCSVYMQWGVFVIKQTRCTNFTNLFCHKTVHVSDSSSVHHQEFIHCTLGNGVCHSGL